MSDLLRKYDAWLSDDGPAALVIREHLMPVEGRDGVLFPPTYAAAEDKSKFGGGYSIDRFADGTNICLIDSAGSQANRVEPCFARKGYDGLVPQITIKAGEHTVNLLEAGHRSGDAIVRCTTLRMSLREAFQARLKGNADPLARVAPTSLVFGVWDSRDTQSRAPRVVGSTIRAHNVRELTRSAQYGPPVNYSEFDVFSDEEKKKAEGMKESPLAQRGFVHVPATGTPGGVIAVGGVRRDATLNLAAVRLLCAGNNDAKTLALRRYILGLALVAFTHPSAFVGYLRQGCTLVLDPEGKPAPRSCEEVRFDGVRRPVSIDHDGAIGFARAVAKSFGLGKDQAVEFDKKLAKADIAAKQK